MTEKPLLVRLDPEIKDFLQENFKSMNSAINDILREYIFEDAYINDKISLAESKLHELKELKQRRSELKIKIISSLTHEERNFINNSREMLKKEKGTLTGHFNAFQTNHPNKRFTFKLFKDMIEGRFFL